MLKGSCACGKIRYEIAGSLNGPVNHCYCQGCRKQSGSGFSSTARVEASVMNVLVGRHLVRSWQHAAGTEHFFASCCGALIYSRDPADLGNLLLPLGTLDCDPKIGKNLHVDTSSKAAWLPPWGLPVIAEGEEIDPVISSLWVTPKGVPRE
ncbi:GFA family protein [Neorhizobium alkalisoli]|uniref:CENP-V/GFA domain-containing protein n=1 Tax=Neorhizobium alkalisoli TaxID=528178 RepID=A0A561QWB0_9HYPH|nr:GFA family protein [Neorhizobium alkalisoli]TWF54616.1 hypothetical protein FHW37_103486 [Neorhizobium alkalisoli]